MKSYKNWLEDNKEQLLEDYSFDVQELLNQAGNDSDYLEQIRSFEDWVAIKYNMEVEDENTDQDSKKGFITCGSCEMKSPEPTEDGECPNCRSGDWVWGDIEDDMDCLHNWQDGICKTCGAVK